mmetsp:Transcript_17290/g.58426  ORF Transcript_17290/g.58426 Transcript_17290/m.58426 type:complete len:244 (-) Transcript_17290:567-1298(-)
MQATVVRDKIESRNARAESPARAKNAGEGHDFGRVDGGEVGRVRRDVPGSTSVDHHPRRCIRRQLRRPVRRGLVSKHVRSDLVDALQAERLGRGVVGDGGGLDAVSLRVGRVVVHEERDARPRRRRLRVYPRDKSGPPIAAVLEAITVATENGRLGGRGGSGVVVAFHALAVRHEAVAGTTVVSKTVVRPLPLRRKSRGLSPRASGVLLRQPRRRRKLLRRRRKLLRRLHQRRLRLRVRTVTL